MLVLGIDPGSNIAGFGIIEVKAKALSLIVSGVIRTKSKSHPEKLKQLFESITEIISTYNPDVVVVESPFLGKNVNSLVKLSQARAIALLCAAIKGARIEEISPREIKKAVTGKGDAEKDIVRLMVGRHLKINVGSISTDASDAIGAALTFIFKKIATN